MGILSDIIEKEYRDELTGMLEQLQIELLSFSDFQNHFYEALLEVEEIVQEELTQFKKIRQKRDDIQKQIEAIEFVIAKGLRDDPLTIGLRELNHHYEVVKLFCKYLRALREEKIDLSNKKKLTQFSEIFLSQACDDFMKTIKNSSGNINEEWDEETLTKWKNEFKKSFTDFQKDIKNDSKLDNLITDREKRADCILKELEELTMEEANRSIAAYEKEPHKTNLKILREADKSLATGMKPKYKYIAQLQSSQKQLSSIKAKLDNKNLLKDLKFLDKLFYFFKWMISIHPAVYMIQRNGSNKVTKSYSYFSSQAGSTGFIYSHMEPSLKRPVPTRKELLSEEERMEMDSPRSMYETDSFVAASTMSASSPRTTSDESNMDGNENTSNESLTNSTGDIQEIGNPDEESEEIFVGQKLHG